MSESVKLPINEQNADDIGGNASVSDRIGELNGALSSTINELQTLCQINACQVLALIIVNGVLLYLAYLFGSALYEIDTYPKDITIFYFIVSRCVLATGFATIVIFTLKLLKVYLNNSKINREKLFILKSMASLVEATEYSNKEVIYNQLLNIIITPTEMPKESNNKVDIDLTTLNNLIELAKKIKL